MQFNYLKNITQDVEYELEKRSDLVLAILENIIPNDSEDFDNQKIIQEVYFNLEQVGVKKQETYSPEDFMFAAIRGFKITGEMYYKLSESVISWCIPPQIKFELLTKSSIASTAILTLGGLLRTAKDKHGKQSETYDIDLAEIIGPNHLKEKLDSATLYCSDAKIKRDLIQLKSTGIKAKLY